MDSKKALDDIKYIKEIMSDAKTATHHFGKFYMVWAGAVILGMTVQLSLIHHNINSPVASITCWLFFMGSALLWDIRESKKLKANAPSKTFVNRMLESIWVSCLAAILTSLFIMPLVTNGEFIYGTAVICLILGIGHYITGVLAGYRVLKFIGIAWWVSFIPILLLIKDGELFQMAVLFAFLMFLLQFIPGLLQSWSAKTENNRSNKEQDVDSNSTSALENVFYIKKLLDDTRKATLNFGAYYIFWSILIVVAIAVEFTISANIFASLDLDPVTEGSMQKAYPHLITPLAVSWLTFIGMGTLWSIRRARSLRGTRHDGTFANKLVGYTWFSVFFSVSIALFLFPILLKGDFPFSAGIIALLYGIGHYINGELCESTLLKRTGIGWWAYSIVLTALGNTGLAIYLGLLFALGLIVFQLIPGFILYKQLDKSEQAL
ncbi:MAG: hypothetical protein OEY64_09040 [Nitrospinota bacterium]|nr:hypothetical protein [Nitrospinota bacterium]